MIKNHEKRAKKSHFSRVSEWLLLIIRIAAIAILSFTKHNHCVIISEKGSMMVVEKSRTNIYLDTNLKEKAKEIYKHYGLSLSEAVNIFLAQSVFNRGLPFEVKIPNDMTLEAMKDVKTGKNYDDVALEDLDK